MTDLRPILSDDPTAAERALFGSARLDVPPVGSKARLLVAMGLHAGAAAAAAHTAGVSSAAAGSGAAAASGTIAAPGTTSTSMAGGAVAKGLVLKWLAIGALAGAVTTGGAEGIASRLSARPASTPTADTTGTRTALRRAPRDGARDTGRSPQEPARESPSPAGAAATARSEDTSLDPATAGSPKQAASRATRDDTTGSPSTRDAARSRPAAPGRSPDPLLAAGGSVTGHEGEVVPGARAALPALPPTLTDEVRSLDGVRRELATSGGIAALAALDAHVAEFRSPRLAPEATLLRIEILTALGRMAEASPVGERFLRANPGSTHAQRVRSLLDGAGRGP